jgi:hypothetical protein
LEINENQLEPQLLLFSGEMSQICLKLENRVGDAANALLTELCQARTSLESVE